MKNIKKLRLQKKLTQLAVQMSAGIDQALLSKYETGERMPTTENLLTLAKFYSTSLDYLMDLTDEPKPYTNP